MEKQLEPAALFSRVFRFTGCLMYVCLFSAIFFLAGNETIAGDGKELSIEELKGLSIEELMNVKITIASRAPENFSSTPAAVSVLTGEDIKRSGATSIPEALRLVPGLQVARLNSHAWAISSRGFNDVFANKLLVMIDGRSVYSPLFSGVFWGVQDTLLEDIDRIEVVRGPGATLWGANAVNGVINIVTKRARETQGGLISGGSGTEEIGFGGMRYGVQLNEQTHLRVYGKYFNRDDSKLSNGNDAHDHWDQARGGLRLDWEPNEVNLFTLQGDVYDGTDAQDFRLTTPSRPFFQTIAGDQDVSGGNALGRWTHIFSGESEMNLQAYYDYTRRSNPIIKEDVHTTDVDFQHQFGLGERQKIIWGSGYRHVADEVVSSLTLALRPASRATDLFSAFVQDEISLIEDKLALTLGSKFEHNDFTGFEIQPGSRLLWTPREGQALWTSVSRAVRTPSRIEDDGVANPPGAPPGFATVFGTHNFDSEKLIAYEIGYRFQPWQRLLVDLTAFYNDYDDLRTFTPLTSARVGPAIGANDLEGETYGFELANTIQLAESWRLNFGYSYLQAQLHRKVSTLSSSAERGVEDSSPHHQFFARSSIDFGRKIQFDSILRYVDTIVVSGMRIPSYVAADIRLAWKPHRNWELAIVGQNLLDNQHPEFNSPAIIVIPPTEVERSVYAKLTWQF